MSQQDQGFEGQIDQSSQDTQPLSPGFGLPEPHRFDAAKQSIGEGTQGNPSQGGRGCLVDYSEKHLWSSGCGVEVEMGYQPVGEVLDIAVDQQQQTTGSGQGKKCLEGLQQGNQPLTTTGSHPG